MIECVINPPAPGDHFSRVSRRARRRSPARSRRSRQTEERRGLAAEPERVRLGCVAGLEVPGRRELQSALLGQPEALDRVQVWPRSVERCTVPPYTQLFAHAYRAPSRGSRTAWLICQPGRSGPSDLERTPFVVPTDEKEALPRSDQQEHAHRPTLTKENRVPKLTEGQAAFLHDEPNVAVVAALRNGRHAAPVRRLGGLGRGARPAQPGHHPQEARVPAERPAGVGARARSQRQLAPGRGRRGRSPRSRPRALTSTSSGRRVSIRGERSTHSPRERSGSSSGSRPNGSRRTTWSSYFRSARISPAARSPVSTAPFR